MNIPFTLVQVLNIVSWLMLFFYGMHYYAICILYLRKKNKNTLPKPVKLTARNKPLVLIQLPVFNEVYVIERLMRNISKIKWPRNKLEIQILDDSNDETLKISRKVAAELRKDGLNIKVVTRKTREGAKAGALKYGMTKSKAEYIAIFDSDFLPKPDFLEKTIPYILAKDNISFVQTRWEHTNRDESLLTYAQSLGIDGHFTIEQPARSMNKLWMNFNGTAGVWRKTAIEEAGHWQGDTLTEDLDLSYRSQLKGWVCLFLPHVDCPAEIPDQILPYKVQQFRWAKGSIQTAKKLLVKIFKSDASKKNKLEAGIHLTYYSIQFLMILNLLTLFPLVLAKQTTLIKASTIPFLLFSFTMFAPITLTMLAQFQLKNNFWKAIRSMPHLFLMGFGISVYITIAFIEAFVGKKSSFIRTPKYNLKNMKDKQDTVKKRKYRVRPNYVLILEILFAIFCFIEAYFIADRSSMIFFYFPILMGISLSYVAYRTIRDNLILNRKQLS